jgi:hypothetical protein
MLDKIYVPETYTIHIQWGGQKKRSHFLYTTSKQGFSFYFTDLNDSVFQKNDFGMKRSVADSLYILAYQNSRQFEMVDTCNFNGPLCSRMQADDYNLSIFIRTRHKSVQNTYYEYADYSKNSDIQRIKEIIKRETKNINLFN